VKLYLSLLAALIIAGSSETLPDASIIVENNILRLSFQADKSAGLIKATDKRTGQTFSFEGSPEFMVKLAAPDWKGEHPERLRALYSNDMQCVNIKALSRTSARLVFAGEGLEIEVNYQLGSNDPFVRKSFRITNTGRPVQIAAFSAVCITGHEVHSAGEASRARKPLIWGRPYYWLEEKGGAFCGTEYPSSRNLKYDQYWVSEYRPCKILETNQSIIPAGGVIGFSTEIGEDGCRRAFEAYLLAIHPPSLPYPVFFCPWGPWLKDITNDQCLAAIRLCPQAGIDMNMIDGRWPDYAKMDPVLINGGTTQDYLDVFSQERFPNGITEIAVATRKAGMKFGLHFKISSLTNQESGVADSPYDLELPDNTGGDKRQCLASSYGQHVRDFVRAVSEQCDLDMIKLDFFHIGDCSAADHSHYPGGYNAVDMQTELMMNIIADARKRKPGVYIYGACGNGWLSPWWAAWVDQLHTQDPGRATEFKENLGRDSKYRALAFERRAVWWDRTIDNWCPPHVVKMDIGGFACQQDTPVAYDPKFQDYVISEGVGWKETLFSTIGLSEVRDFRLNLLATTPSDRAFMKNWLDWGRKNAGYFTSTRPFTPEPDGTHVEGYANIKNNKGFLFLFNPSNKPQEIAIPIDASIGLSNENNLFGFSMLYPEKTKGQFLVSAYGNTVRLMMQPESTMILAVNKGSQVDSTAKRIIEAYQADAQIIARPYEPRLGCTIDDVRALLAGGAALIAPVDAPADKLIASWAKRAFELIAGQDLPTSSRPTKGNLVVVASKTGFELLKKVGVDVRSKWDDDFIVAADGSMVSGPVVEIRPNPLDPSAKILIVAAPEREQLWPAIEKLREAFLPPNPTVIKRWDKLAPHADLGEVEIPTSGAALRLTPVLPPDVADRSAAVRLKVNLVPSGKTLLDEQLVSMIGYDKFSNLPMERTKIVSLASLAGHKVHLELSAERWPARGNPPAKFDWGVVELITTAGR